MNEGNPTHRILTSRSDFYEAVREAFAQASVAGSREIFISDIDFADWPLGEQAVVENLKQWAYAHRKFTVLALHYDEVSRRHPRWVAWRRQWAHVVECRAFTEAEAGQFPSMLIVPGLVTLRLIDPVHYRAIVSSETVDLVHSRELLDACLQRSEASFPSTIAGL